MKSFTRPRSRAFVLLSLGLAVACSGHDTTGRSRGAAASPSDKEPASQELRAKLVSVTTSGELCPQSPYDSNDDGFADNVHFAQDDEIVGVSTGPVGGPLAPPAQEPTSTPGCVVTLELEVPEGFQMGVPRVRWLGYSGERVGLVNVARTYAFDGGERATASSKIVGDFNFVDQGLAAFSSNCNGKQRVRVTATLQATVPSPGDLQLDQVEFALSQRTGTQFKQGCSSGPISSPPSAGVDEWCGGYAKRACAPGLVCEYIQGRTSEETHAMDRGNCVEISSSLPPAGFRELCGGVNDIRCTSGLVCWHQDQHAADQKWLGTCYPSPADFVGAPCGRGLPALGCEAPLVCWENDQCILPRGEQGDRCGQPNLPACMSPLYCHQGICDEATGRRGEPCDKPEYAPCRNPYTCQQGRCDPPRSAGDDEDGDQDNDEYSDDSLR